MFAFHIDVPSSINLRKATKKSQMKPGLAPAELQRLCYLVNKGKEGVLQSQTLITTEPTNN